MNRFAKRFVIAGITLSLFFDAFSESKSISINELSFTKLKPAVEEIWTKETNFAKNEIATKLREFKHDGAIGGLSIKEGCIVLSKVKLSDRLTLDEVKIEQDDTKIKISGEWGCVWLNKKIQDEIIKEIESASRRLNINSELSTINETKREFAKGIKSKVDVLNLPIDVHKILEEKIHEGHKFSNLTNPASIDILNSISKICNYDEEIRSNIEKEIKKIEIKNDNETAEELIKEVKSEVKADLPIGIHKIFEEKIREGLSNLPNLPSSNILSSKICNYAEEIQSKIEEEIKKIEIKNDNETKISNSNLLFENLKQSFQGELKLPIDLTNNVNSISKIYEALRTKIHAEIFPDLTKNAIMTMLANSSAVIDVQKGLGKFLQFFTIICNGRQIRPQSIMNVLQYNGIQKLYINGEILNSLHSPDLRTKLSAFNAAIARDVFCIDRINNSLNSSLAIFFRSYAPPCVKTEAVNYFENVESWLDSHSAATVHNAMAIFAPHSLFSFYFAKVNWLMKYEPLIGLGANSRIKLLEGGLILPIRFTIGKIDSTFAMRTGIAHIDFSSNLFIDDWRAPLCTWHGLIPNGEFALSASMNNFDIVVRAIPQFNLEQRRISVFPETKVLWSKKF